MSEAPLEREFQQYASLMKLIEGQEMTVAEIAAAIASVRNFLDVAKNLAEAKDDAKQLQLLQTINSATRKLFELESELVEKDRKIRELEEKLTQKEKPNFKKRGEFWYSAEDNEPCCRNCSDKHGRIVYLDNWNYHGTKLGYKCPECGKMTGSSQ